MALKLTYGQLAYRQWCIARASTGLNTPTWESILEDERYQWERVGQDVASAGQHLAGRMAFPMGLPGTAFDDEIRWSGAIPPTDDNGGG